ncbi:MAG: hypothetical protein INR62_10545 [Rhodospirillales bacterium]|nr:hypothetical protein [Acetobacter sp.]
MIEVLLTKYQHLATALLGEIDWQDGGKGYCPCPGKHLHTGSAGRRDCTVFVDPHRAPTIYCVHTSCAAVIAERNHALRSSCGKAKSALMQGGVLPATKRRRLTAEERAQRERMRHLDLLQKQATAALPGILLKRAWPVAAMHADSPVCLSSTNEHWRLLLGLYQPEDVVWIGGKKDSGQLRHGRYFRPAGSWLQETFCPLGPLVAASTFTPGTFQRSRGRVAASRFLVVESDSLHAGEIGAVFRFLRDAEGLALHAVIDTGGRSLHGWFARPAAPERLEELLTVLPAMGCDPGPMREPCLSRLPGAWRGTRQQKLIYFDSHAQSPGTHQPAAVPPAAA